MLRAWIYTLIFTALVCSVMLTLTPNGRVRRAQELLCGIVTVIALLSVIKSLDMGSYSEYLGKFKADAESFVNEGECYSKNLNRTVIEDRTEAYILDKAENSGVRIDDIVITAAWSDEGFWYPYEAEIRSDCGETDERDLSSWMEAELGITKEMQTWS